MHGRRGCPECVNPFPEGGARVERDKGGGERVACNSASLIGYRNYLRTQSMERNPRGCMMLWLCFVV